MLAGLKNLVWQSDDKDAPPQPPQVTPVTPPPAPVVAAPPPVAPSAGSVFDVAGLEAQIHSLITQDPAYAVFAGFDTVITNLGAIIPDEATRFKAAAASTGKAGAELIASVSASVSTVLERESQNFQQSFLAGLEQEVAAIQAESSSVGAEIQELTAKLGELSARKTQLSSDEISKSGDLAKAKIDFQSVTQRVDQKYTELKNKLQQHLGA